MNVDIATDLKCFHCGQPCDDTLWLADKAFCCYGCKTVYEILNSNDLCEYYALNNNPGIQQKEISHELYAYLDDDAVRKSIIEFDSPEFSKVRFYIPAIHCVSCIWLLENLHKLDSAILRSEVNFPSKSVRIDFNPKEIKLSYLADLIHRVGYAPQITLEKEKNETSRTDKALIFKLAVAGFCFGNVMLFSFPEYLGIDHSDRILMRAFSALNLLLSIPVLFYSGKDYLRSAVKSFKQKQINIDVPIAIGLLALFSRSAWDIVTSHGPGYLDSFTGLVFFLLIGRWFQGKTYQSLAFDRDFKSYFPLAVQKRVDDEWKPAIIYTLEKGDEIRIRNMEVIPADAILIDDNAYIDYSFVTGESKPVYIKRNDLVYAGGRLIGKPITLTVENKTSQSHLTSLWNHDAFRKTEENKYQKIIDKAARRFTWVVLVIAAVTACYWYVVVPSQVWLILTSVLMVACPCALALAAPFTYGSMLRVFGKYKLYVKNADVVERIASINAVVFDKTGTVTHHDAPEIKFEGEFDNNDLAAIKLLTSYSTHPLSVLITKFIKNKSILVVTEFKELPGKGIEGVVNGSLVRIGSAPFVGFLQNMDNQSSRVFVSIDNNVKGFFSIKTSVRSHLKDMLEQLGNCPIALLSGDNDSDRQQMKMLFGSNVQLLFNQSPHDKLDYIRKLQGEGKKVMMVGDGLNDSGALKQSDVGIVVTDDTGIFTPACDAILQGDQIQYLATFMKFAKSSSVILKTAFGISFMYNAVALSFAVSGHLTPLTAAILMPLSSISVVGFSSFAVNYIASRENIGTL